MLPPSPGAAADGPNNDTQSLEEELERVTPLPPRSDLITGLLANSARSLTLACQAESWTVPNAASRIQKLLDGSRCRSAYTWVHLWLSRKILPAFANKSRPSLRIPDGSVCLRSVFAAQKFVAYITNYAQLWAAAIGRRGRTSNFCLLYLVGISAFLIALHGSSRGLRETSSPIQLSLTEPSTTQFSSDEAFWAAVQAG